MTDSLDYARALRNVRKPIGLKLTEDLVALAVAERGSDYTYCRLDGTKAPTFCSNWEWDEDAGDGYGMWVPSCIVGLVVSYLVDINDPEYQEFVGWSAGELNARLGIFDYEAAMYLVDVQKLQDRGYPWGAAARGIEDEAYEPR